MATPNEKLAASLQVLKSLQDSGVSVFQASTLPELTRVHRERLQKAGFLTQVILGWYIPCSPDDVAGDSTIWYANMSEFIAAYATSKFGDEWQLTPELSLLKHSGHTSVDKQIQLHAPKANNQSQGLPHGCSFFQYRVKPEALVASRSRNSSGLMLLPLANALMRASPSFFHLHQLAAQIAVRQVDISTLIRLLLDGGHSVVAGRMAGALTAVGRQDDAKQLLNTMKAAGYAVTEENPFQRPLAQIGGRLTESPYVQRIQAMWSSMRHDVIARFENVSLQKPLKPEELLADIRARYVADAYHSLSIEGYRVNAALIEKVRSGGWSPLTNLEDRETRDAMAAKGYAEVHKRVSELIGKVTSGESDAISTFKGDFSQWYVTV